jgi:hypothetical protein
MTRNKSGAPLLTMQRFTIITGRCTQRIVYDYPAFHAVSRTIEGEAKGAANAYIDWAKDKELARNEDARFVSWVRSFTKGKASP